MSQPQDFLKEWENGLNSAVQGIQWHLTSVNTQIMGVSNQIMNTLPSITESLPATQPVESYSPSGAWTQRSVPVTSKSMRGHEESRRAQHLNPSAAQPLNLGRRNSSSTLSKAQTIRRSQSVETPKSQDPRKKVSRRSSMSGPFKKQDSCDEATRDKIELWLNRANSG
mmetsp:Transcript_29857/g.46814  ORF Transcript_29857/g.46814 Transcript_29857/m.46814 type:complete len:168 (-) Transcript_29857:414-917(-)